ncbi:MAG: S49 family peptidase [Aeromonas veronii]
MTMSKGLALRFLSTKQWALSPDILEVMGTIAARDLEGIDLSALGDAKPVALLTRNGKRNQSGIEVRDGVAIIPVQGVISRYAGMFEAICGGTSTQTLAKTIQAALDDHTIRGIVLVVDTPGGEANGIHELAELIHSARGKKKITAYVSGYAASAGYWVAAAAEEVVIDAIAYAGSIGTVQTFKFRKDREDVETLELVSSQSPYKRLDPRTKEGQEKYQQALDGMSDVFINCVAKYRGVSRDHALEHFGQGWCLMGADAVKAKMADRLGNLESVINEMSKGRNNMPNTNKFAALSFSEGMATADVVAALGELRPDVVAALSDGGFEVQTMTADMVPGFLEGMPEDVTAAFKAALADEAPAMAIDSAADIVKAAAAAGVPEMAASLLTDGMTKAQAEGQIAFAGGLRDVLAASGLSGSLSALLEHSADPVKMVATAIHEASAKAAETSAVESETKGKAAATLSAREIYAQRNSAG